MRWLKTLGKACAEDNVCVALLIDTKAIRTVLYQITRQQEDSKTWKVMFNVIGKEDQQGFCYGSWSFNWWCKSHYSAYTYSAEQICVNLCLLINILPESKCWGLFTRNEWKAYKRERCVNICTVGALSMKQKERVMLLHTSKSLFQNALVTTATFIVTLFTRRRLQTSWKLI
jgi:hypothetical protein